MANENVCRTCLQIFKNNEVVHLNATEDDSDSISLRAKLQACVPELTVDIVHDPVICNTCCAAIILTYQFKSSCLENEKALYKFIKQRKQNPYDLLTTSDLLKIVRKDINDEHSYSFVEKCYSNGYISNSESDSDTSQPKLPVTIRTTLEDIVKQALADSPCRNFADSEDIQETFYPISKTKVKTEKMKEVIKNEGSIKSTTPFKSPKTLYGRKEVVSTSPTIIASKSVSINKLSTSGSVNINSKQTVNTRKQSSLKAANIPEDAEITEDGCKVPKKTEKHKQRKQTKPKRNLLHDIKHRDCKSLPKNIESQENFETDLKMETRKSSTKKRLLTDEIIAGSQKKQLKKEFDSDSKTASTNLSKSVSTRSVKQNDSEMDKNVPSTPSFTKKSFSDRDIRSVRNTSIDNDLLEINEIIMKNDLLQLPKLSCYRRNSQRYHCSKCNKAYNYKSHFDVHLKSHIFKKLYTCPICKKDFAQEKYLKSHALLHTTTPGSYQCDICLKHLSASTALKRHYRIHTGEKPHLCTCCNKRFSQKIQLAVHMRTHTGFKPYTCFECKADFTQKSHLMGHMRIHTGEKPYKCDKCPKSFRKSYALQIHKHSHSIKPFQCGACNFLLRDADTFQKHVNKHLACMANSSSRTLKTPKSKRKLLDELEQDIKDINLAAGLHGGSGSKVEPKVLHYCNVCNREFSTKFSMLRHAKVHGKGRAKSLTL